MSSIRSVDHIARLSCPIYPNMAYLQHFLLLSGYLVVTFAFSFNHLAYRSDCAPAWPDMHNNAFCQSVLPVDVYRSRIDCSQQFIQFMLRACLVKSTMDLGLEPSSLHDETVRFATESFVNLYIAYIDSGIYSLHYSPFLRTKRGSKNTPEYFSSITPLSCVLSEGARTTGEID
jgi:hypothetical protein